MTSLLSLDGAACLQRLDLPWIDGVPTADDAHRMGAVCAGCPVLAACAVLAPNQTGGFWAGKYRTGTGLRVTCAATGAARVLARRAERRRTSTITDWIQDTLTAFTLGSR